jgi:RNA polymerase sigma-70 factor (ECF subfamily)
MTQTRTKTTHAHTAIDDALVAKAAGGDEAALALIYDTYARDIYRYHYSRVGNVPDAEDLTAQTFMAVLEVLPSYQPRGLFRAWIFRISYHKLMDYYRQQKHLAVQISPEIPVLEEKLDGVIQDQAQELLAALFEALPEAERELIRLRYLVGLTYAEIGMVLGRKEDAVRKRLNRLLVRLHDQMEVQNG